jgi:hypothetical protein
MSDNPFSKIIHYNSDFVIVNYFFIPLVGVTHEGSWFLHINIFT